MSLFQCDKCGCVENTASSDGGWHAPYLLGRSNMDEGNKEAIESYRKVMGLKEGEEFGHYCCVCSPSWFTEKGSYGVGEKPELNPNLVRRPSERKNLREWHNRFPRMFLPMGEYTTAPNGNLMNKKTKSEKFEKDVINKEVLTK
jgi:hypothetical protein